MSYNWGSAFPCWRLLIYVVPFYHNSLLMSWNIIIVPVKSSAIWAQMIAPLKLYVASLHHALKTHTVSTCFCISFKLWKRYSWIERDLIWLSCAWYFLFTVMFLMAPSILFYLCFGISVNWLSTVLMCSGWLELFSLWFNPFNLSFFTLPYPAEQLACQATENSPVQTCLAVSTHVMVTL